MPHRLDAIQIKTTLTMTGARPAADRLGLVACAEGRRVYFCEDVAAAGPLSLPLLDRGLILRLRQTSDAWIESTVKLRPCLRSKVAAHWPALHRRDEHRLRLEADWSDAGSVLAASLLTSRSESRLEEVLTGHAPLRGMFSDLQRQFLDGYAGAPVDLDRLTVLGPITVHECDPVTWRGYDVAAQWWTLPGGEALLELTLRVEPPGAEIIARGFDAVLRDAGVTAPRVTAPKTRLVLESLVRISRPPGRP